MLWHKQYSYTIFIQWPKPVHPCLNPLMDRFYRGKTGGHRGEQCNLAVILTALH